MSDERENMQKSISPRHAISHSISSHSGWMRSKKTNKWSSSADRVDDHHRPARSQNPKESRHTTSREEWMLSNLIFRLESSTARRKNSSDCSNSDIEKVHRQRTERNIKFISMHYAYIFTLINYAHHLHQGLLPLLHQGKKSPHFYRSDLRGNRCYSWSRDSHEDRREISYTHRPSDISRRRVSRRIRLDQCDAQWREARKKTRDPDNLELQVMLTSRSMSPNFQQHMQSWGRRERSLQS